MTITVKEAAKAAMVFAEQMLNPEMVTDVRLEEIEDEIIKDREVWAITLSFPELPKDVLSNTWTSEIEALRRRVKPRTYKRFFVDKESGSVLSMKIRELALA